MRFNCIIVEEDDAIRSVFEAYIATLPAIELLGSFNNISAAQHFLEHNNTDVMFTDVSTQDFVSMHQSGFMQPSPAFVFTTTDAAVSQIGFDLDAVDCLVKPFSFDRFLKTIDKVYRRLQPPVFKDTTYTEPNYCFVKTDQNFIKVEYDKIRYVEGLENYVRIYCENKTVLALNTMKNMEAALSPFHFLRIHRSYLVNLDKVESVLNYNFHVGEKVLPVGKSYRKNISDILKHAYAIRSIA